MQDNPADGSLSATAAVALRWRIAASGDPALIEAECAAGMRALAACLEAEGARQDVLPPDRIEAKVDLLLASLERLSSALEPAAAGGRSTFLDCQARFGMTSIEWDDPLPPPPDGILVILELRAAPGQPVTARLPATLACIEGSSTGVPRLCATPGPMSAAAREAYERCVFVLHRRAIRAERERGGTAIDRRQSAAPAIYSRLAP